MNTWKTKKEKRILSYKSFREFLLEIDVGDLELAKQHADQEAADAEAGRSQGQFKQEMAATPSKGDVIQSAKGYYIVIKMSPQGIHVQQAGGNSTATIPHGTKFKSVGKAPSGKPAFQIVK